LAKNSGRRSTWLRPNFGIFYDVSNYHLLLLQRAAQNRIARIGDVKLTGFCGTDT